MEEAMGAIASPDYFVPPFQVRALRDGLPVHN